MFQFRRFPSYTYLFSVWCHDFTHDGLLHSDICGSTLACNSPQLFAAYRVLLRLPMPRHPPCALISLTLLWSELCFLFRLKFFWNCSFITLSYWKYLKLFIFSSLHLLLLYSVFKVQIETFLFRNSKPFLPLASDFLASDWDIPFKNSKVFSCLLLLNFLPLNGHKWTRTIDLTLIRRAL